jgi:hypothetical protein
LTCAARTILVQTPGIADATRLALAACGPAADLRVVAPVSTKVRIVATAATREADSAAFLGADGGKIAATITHGNQAWGAKDIALVDGQSEVVVVPDDAVTLVLFKQGKETLRLPVALTPERLHELRP